MPAGVVWRSLDRIRIDDPVGAASVHGVCGAWGMPAVGLFAIDGIGMHAGGGMPQLMTQLVVAIAVFVFVAAAALALFLGSSEPAAGDHWKRRNALGSTSSSTKLRIRPRTGLGSRMDARSEPGGRATP